jgi:hypothetical protein
MQMKDRSGQRFGRLVAIRPAGKTKEGRISWLCRCDCGVDKVISGGPLNAGHAKSCGCLLGENIKTHGLSGTPAHRSWKAAKQRCLNPKASNYARYGGRGITMDPVWATDFSVFLADMGQPPSARMELDRIDSDGNYEPGNCRWATRTQQVLNTSRTIWVAHEGETISATEFSRRIGIGRNIDYRLKRPAVKAARALGAIPSALLL